MAAAKAAHSAAWEAAIANDGALPIVPEAAAALEDTAEVAAAKAAHSAAWEAALAAALAAPEEATPTVRLAAAAALPLGAFSFAGLPISGYPIAGYPLSGAVAVNYRIAARR